ncbi:MAG: DUF885 domain-containing protein [Firmicutes bacterium]|nr:DUF885 domain-containing protein [Bacillota bacterium]
MIENTEFLSGLPAHPILRSVALHVLEGYFERYPSFATDLGLHQWDDKMPSFTMEARQLFVAILDAADKDMQRVDPSQLSPSDLADYHTLTNQIQLLRLDELRDVWEEKDPNIVNSIISGALLSLVRREFAPLEERGRHILSRLKASIALLDQVQVILDNPPEIFVQMAIAQFEASIPLFTEVIPQVFSKVSVDLSMQVENAAEALAKRYREFITFLQEKLLPRSHGDYRLGAQRYQERLALQEGVTTPLDTLLEQGYAELHRLQALFRETVAAINPHLSPEEVLAGVRRQHPLAQDLLNQVANTLIELRTFCEERDLISIPQAPDPDVVETPAYMRETTLASIDPPGPFETEALQSFYQVTLPDPGWTSEQKEQLLEGFNYWGLHIISAHEVYPGHYVQFLHLRSGGSTVRKVFASGAFVEGWAHYTEEMVVDEGLGSGDPAMRLIQVMEALERVGRFIAGIEMHTGRRTFAEAQELFEKECYMAPVHARREALRGTEDPFYLIYTLGKLEILQLRREARKRWGSQFTLRRFHDALLSYGYPTFPILKTLLFS